LTTATSAISLRERLYGTGSHVRQDNDK
jgi:hypothetical protein